MDALRNIVHGHTGAAALRGAGVGTGGAFVKQSGSGAFVHAHAVIGDHNQNRIFAIPVDRHVDHQCIVAHTMAHGILDDWLDYKCRHQRVLDVLGHVEGRQHAILAKARLLKRQVALGLRDLARHGNERARIVERGAIERGELAQQLAGAQRIGTRKRRDGVERVEQEVRVDLRLQGTHLGTGRELLLHLELVDGELRGQDLGKTRGKRVLSAVDGTRGLVVELERADGAVAHLDRSDDTGGNMVVRAIRTHHVHHTVERLDDTVLDDVARGKCVDGRIGQQLLLKLARAGQHVALVGDGNRHGTRLGQNALAHQTRRLLRQTAFDVLEHGRGHRECLFGVLRTHRIGIERQIDKNAQKDAQQCAGDHGRDRLDSSRQGKNKVHQHANGADNGDHAKD